MLKHRLVIVIVLALMASACGAAGRAFRKGQEASRTGDWDTAVAEYTKAVHENPDKAEYKITLERAMQTASREHISRARDLETKDQLDVALLEYKKALELDPSNRLAHARSVELEKMIRDRIEATRPKPPIEALRDQARRAATPLLSPTAPLPVVSFGPNASLRDILSFIGTATGINVTFDPQYADKAYTVRLEDVTLEQALQQIMSANGSSTRSSTRRRSSSSPTTRRSTRSTTTWSSGCSTSRTPTRRSSRRRSTRSCASRRCRCSRRCCRTRPPTRSRCARRRRSWTSSSGSSAPTTSRARRSSSTSQILEVNRKRTKDLGINLSNYSLGLMFSPEVAPPNTSGSIPPAAPPPFNLNTISQGISTSDFYLSVPTAVVNFLEQDTRTKLIAKPQLRGAEGKKLTLNLGDEIPVLSTVFGAAAAGGFASVPQSSYNYKPVGVNLAMTPRVTYEGEIVLDGFLVENSALGRQHQRGGQDVPSFRSRKVHTMLRLREGESTLLAGLMRDEQRKILSGFPGIIRMPVLRSLFGQTTDEINQSDIVMLITPHIVRTHELTMEDLSPIYIGTQANVGLGGPPPLIAPQPVEAPAPTAAPAPAVPATPAETVPGVPRTLASPPPGVPPLNPPKPAGTSPVPTLTPPGAVPPTGAPTVGPAPAATPPVAEPVPALPPKVPEAPPRDPNAPPVAPPGPGAAATPAQIIVTPPARNSASRVGRTRSRFRSTTRRACRTLTLTVTYNPTVLRVRTVQDGTFMRQGGITTSFTPRIDAPAGRVDIAITRAGDQTGASGAGLLAALLFDAVGPGGSVIQVSGVANAPDGAPIRCSSSRSR